MPVKTEARPKQKVRDIAAELTLRAAESVRAHEAHETLTEKKDPKKETAPKATPESKAKPETKSQAREYRQKPTSEKAETVIKKSNDVERKRTSRAARKGKAAEEEPETIKNIGAEKPEPVLEKTAAGPGDKLPRSIKEEVFQPDNGISSENAEPTKLKENRAIIEPGEELYAEENEASDKAPEAVDANGQDSTEAEHAAATIDDGLLDAFLDAELINEEDSDIDYDATEHDSLTELLDNTEVKTEEPRSAIHIGSLGLERLVDLTELVEDTPRMEVKPEEDLLLSQPNVMHSKKEYFENEAVFSEFIESIQDSELERAEKATELLGELKSMINNAREKILKDDLDTETIKVVEWEIEVCLEMLLHVLNLTYDETEVRKCVGMLLDEFIERKPDKNEKDIEVLNRLGTREYKAQTVTSIVSSMILSINNKTGHLRRLGRTMLLASAA